MRNGPFLAGYWKNFVRRSRARNNLGQLRDPLRSLDRQTTASIGADGGQQRNESHGAIHIATMVHSIPPVSLLLSYLTSDYPRSVRAFGAVAFPNGLPARNLLSLEGREGTERCCARGNGGRQRSARPRSWRLKRLAHSTPSFCRRLLMASDSALARSALTADRAASKSPRLIASKIKRCPGIKWSGPGQALR